MNDAIYQRLKGAVLRDLMKRASAEQFHAEDARKPDVTTEYKKAVEDALTEWRAFKDASADGKLK